MTNLPGELARVRGFIGLADEFGRPAAFTVRLVHVLGHPQPVGGRAKKGNY